MTQSTGAANCIEVTTTEQLGTTRRLFEEYQADTGIDLCFQGFARELETLPGAYAAPRGRLFLVELGDEPAGCVALRPLEPNVCEMKRLYIRPSFRGRALGRVAAERIVAEARTIGYERMRLDTLQTMLPAITLYRSLGFRDIEPYYANPIASAVYLELDLTMPPR